MIGLLVLAIAGLYIAFWVWVVVTAKRRSVQVVAILVALAIPFWDVPIGYYNYRMYCDVEAGTRVLQGFEAQEKIYFDSMPSYSANELLRLGFKVVEIARADRQGIARHEKSGTEQILTTVVQASESKITVSISRNQRLPWNIVREDRLARLRSTNEVLARHSAFRWYGGWLSKRLPSMLPIRASCAVSPQDPIVELVRRGT